MKNFTTIVIHNSVRTESATITIENDHLKTAVAGFSCSTPLFLEEDGYPIELVLDNAWQVIKTVLNQPITTDLEATVRGLISSPLEAWLEDKRDNDPQYREYKVRFWGEDGSPAEYVSTFKRLVASIPTIEHRLDFYRKRIDRNPDNATMKMRRDSWEGRLAEVIRIIDEHTCPSEELLAVMTEADHAMSA